MKSVRGELSFEGILSMAFLSVIIATIIAVLQFYEARKPGNSDNFDITQSYNTILTSLREDSQTAAIAEISSDSVNLLDSQSDQICRYAVIDNNLCRLDKSGKGEILLKQVESASFKTSDGLDNLLTVKILPADKMEIPFFTSFALRGVNNDLQ